MEKVTPRGARNLTRLMDRVSSTIEHAATDLKLDARIAKDFVFRSDFLSDMVEKSAGLTRQMKANFDAEDIGREVRGPDEQEPDEPYMTQEFSQQGNRELRELQESGDLGTTPVTEQQTPTQGVQASFKGLITSLKKVDPRSRRAKRVAYALELARRVAEGKEEPQEEPDEEEEPKGKEANTIKLDA